MPAVPPEMRGETARSLTVVPTAKTVFASDSSCDLPVDEELVDEVVAEQRPVRVPRRITLGDGVLERVPQRPAWFLPTVVAITTITAALVLVVT